MRAAVAPNTAKALRVAIVVEGRIIEERIFRERARVSGLVDDRLTLFDVRDGAWFLCVPNGVARSRGDGTRPRGRGADRVARAPRRVSARQDRRRQVDGALPVRRAAAEASPAQLPLSTKGRQIDWTLTVIVAFSFLVHFGVIGAMFSDWADPVVASEDNVVSVIDMTQKLPQNTVVEDRETPSTTTTTTPSTSTPASTSTRRRACRAKREPPRSRTTPKRCR